MSCLIKNALKRVNAKWVIVTGMILVLGLSLFSPVSAKDYPNEAVTAVVPFPAGGGGTGRWVRIMASSAYEEWGVDWRVRNVPGASAVAGWKWLLKKPANGYTLMQSSPTPVIALSRESKPVLNPDKDIKIVAVVSKFYPVILAHKNAPFQDFEGLIAYAKKNPKKLVLGGSGSNILGAVNLLQQFGVELTYVIYDGSGKAMTDFLGNHINMAVIPMISAMSHAPEKATAIVSCSSSPHKKGFEKVIGKKIPNAADLGKSGFSGLRWIGVHPDTPEPICDKISMLIEKTVTSPGAKSLLKKIKEQVFFSGKDVARKEYAEMVKAVKASVSVLDKK